MAENGPAAPPKCPHVEFLGNPPYSVCRAPIPDAPNCTIAWGYKHCAYYHRARAEVAEKKIAEAVTVLEESVGLNDKATRDFLTRKAVRLLKGGSE